MANLLVKQHHLNAGNVNKGTMMAKENSKMDMAQDKKMAKKAIGMHDKQMHGGKKTNLAALKSGGCAKMAKGGGIEKRGKTKGRII
jgi:hypothetical protein